MSDLEYYSFDKVLSYNGVYNFIVGARGLGKTYGAKRKVIKDYIRKRHQFIYLRRYSTELKTRSTFFADIFHEFPDVGLRVNGNVAEITFNPLDNEPRWEVMGYFVQLSNAQSRKSVAYPRVTTIIYDEFIIEKGAVHYLPEEAKVFNDFYSTVDRYKDKTKVLFLANALTIMNPYFLEHKIEPADWELRTFHDNFIVVHFPDSTEFSKGVYKTRFGKFIQGSEYADFAVGNVFHDNNYNLIARKPPEATYRCTITVSTGTFSVWVHDGWDFSRFYLQRRRPKDELRFTTEAHLVNEDCHLLTYGHGLLQHLRAAYSGGRMFFDSPMTRNAFVGVYKR